jgi:radical SAM peptide maturase (CXXX-repeat target family)/CXXX repeat peptide maturase
MDKDNTYTMGKRLIAWNESDAQSITFVVTQDCNLKCKYCYMTKKNNGNKMSFDIAKSAIDYMLDNKLYFNRNSVIFDFIGGEPFLEIELIDKISDYFKIETYKKNHPWFDQYRFNFSSNGLLYSDPKVQKYITKNNGKVSIGITIDGIKEKHDLQRIYSNGKGSYENVLQQVKLCMKQLGMNHTKVTIGHEDLPYLKDSILHLWSIGLTNISANVVFEDVWLENDDVLFQQQLIELSDYIIENELWKTHNTTLFSEFIGIPLQKSNWEHNYCGAGKMFVVDAKGDFYPCIRFMGYSLNSAKPIRIGSVHTGLDYDKLRPFYALNSKVQSDNECLNCPIGGGCAWCQGYNYDVSENETIYSRSKSICKMHKARVRANTRYWARLRKEKNIVYQNNLFYKNRLFILISDDCVSHCKYDTNSTSNLFMDEGIIERASEFAAHNFYTPVILHSKTVNTQKYTAPYFKYQNTIDVISAQNEYIYTSNDNNRLVCFNSQDVFNAESGAYNAILNIDEQDFPNIHELVIALLQKSARVNVNIRHDMFDVDTEKYEMSLDLIIAFLHESYMNDNRKQLNIITDRLFLKEMRNCGAGDYSITLAPNGKFYYCPAFYFNDDRNHIGSLEEGIKLTYDSIFSMKYALICNKCDAFHCKRCVYLNKVRTNEYCIPSKRQCNIAHIERAASKKLFDMLIRDKCNDIVSNMNKIPNIEYSDPFRILENVKNDIEENQWIKI